LSTVTREQVLAEVEELAQQILQASHRPAQLMEVCGTHSHEVARYGLRQLLPEELTLLSGPGCPVCVTPTGELDAAIEIARLPGVQIATFGDMIRVPGSDSTLGNERARGAKVRVVFSPIEAVEMAADDNGEVVWLGVGFETTAPGVACAVSEAKRRGLRNFSVLCLHKLMPPALEVLLDAEDVSVDGLIAPGHVSTIIGSDTYKPLAEKFTTPIAVTGFEPDDIMRGVLSLVEQLRDGRAEVTNVYERCVAPQGNTRAQEMMLEVFEPADVEWRGLGVILGGGLKLREEYGEMDALKRHDVEVREGRDDPRCRCAEVLRGVLRPAECGAFGKVCTPAHPLGPCMVSSEGACAAAHKYGI